jgi:hypothetical protein
MSKLIIRLISLFLVFQLTIPYSAFAAKTGEFKSVTGDVRQTRAKVVITPIVDSPILPKDLITTEKASSATMAFPDESIIKLEQNSKLEIMEFLFKEKSRTAVFFLSVGKIAVKVSRYIGGDNVFEVQSPTAIVGVRGTGFEFDEAVNAENKNVATVSCTEGSLNLSALSPEKKVISTAILYAGQMAVIIGGVITISPIASASETTAKTGLSTAAKVGIVAGGIAGVGAIAAAAASGGGGDDDDSSTPTTPTSPSSPESATLSFRLYEASSDDFDMIITKPNGSTIYFYNTSEYSQDSVGGSGPDIAYWQTPLHGTYTIQIQCYTNNNYGVSKNVSLEVWKNGIRTSTLLTTTVSGTVSNGAIVGSATYTY